MVSNVARCQQPVYGAYDESVLLFCVVVVFSLSLSLSSISVDPFMYYSIPEVHRASLYHKNVDYNDITGLSDSDDSRSSSRRQSESQEGEEPTEQPQAETAEDARKVSRNTRVSFECHSSVLLEDIMDEMEQGFDEELLDDMFESMYAVSR